MKVVHAIGVINGILIRKMHEKANYKIKGKNVFIDRDDRNV